MGCCHCRRLHFVARWQGQLSPRTVLWTTLAIWIIAAILIVVGRDWFNLRAQFERSGAYTGLIVVLLVLAPIYWRLLSVQVFPRGDGGIYSGSAGNDLNFHAALISSFRYGQNFPPTYPLLPPERLLYPFMPDFHAAVLMAGGLSLRPAIILTALVLGAVIAGLFYAFALRIARSSRTATLATLLFLLNGDLDSIQLLSARLVAGRQIHVRILEYADSQLRKALRARYPLEQHRGRHVGAAANQPVRTVNRADDLHELRDCLAALACRRRNRNESK